MTSQFDTIVSTLLTKYASTPIADRWKEANSFGAGYNADAFWIRDSEEVVNIVWLNRDGLRDITIKPDGYESMFNFLPLTSIATFEVREGVGTNAYYGLHVSGDFVVLIVPFSPAGQLYWIAGDENEKKALKEFLATVLETYARKSST